MALKISSYLFKLTFIIFLAVFSLISCSSKHNETVKKPLPNIIYILVDDMGYGDLGCYGQKILKTPFIDQLAADGIKFTQHYAGSSVCAPSRASFMTGRDTGHSWVRGNYETGKYGFGGELELRPEDVTIAELLKREANYRTGVIGKWGMGMDGSTGEPNKKGFDYSFGFLNQAHAHWHYPEFLYRNGKKVDIKENENGKKGYFSSDIFTDEALQFIDREKDRPFFLYLAYTAPHAELLVPQDSIFIHYKGMFDETPFQATKQGSGRDDSLGYYHAQPYPKAAYAAMIAHIDNDVHRIMSDLKKRGIDENTVVMFTSDNGPHDEGGANPEYFESNGPLRGKKRDLYEGGIRVPFIVRWPDKISGGRVSDHISAFWDMLPTMADIANIQIKNISTDGISLLPTLENDTSDQKQHDYLYWEFHERKYTDQAILKGKWKAVRHDPQGVIELYDLDTDLSEKNDVADKNPDLVEDMKMLMTKARTESPYWHLKSSSQISN